jgi:phosphoribosylformylglycinamidine synthase
MRRIERSRRYALLSRDPLSESQLRAFAALVHDRMTEEVYEAKLDSFRVATLPVPVETVPLLAQGKDALRAADERYGFAFDEFDIDFYARLFGEKLERDPTTVELFDLAQSNSEHSRHWFFKVLDLTAVAS